MTTLSKKKLASFISKNHTDLLQKLRNSVYFCQFANSADGDGVIFEENYRERYSIFQYLNKKIINNCPIDYIEFGVFEGSSIKKWMELNNNADSRFYGFDTFTGLPEDWGNKPRNSFDMQGVPPSLEDKRVIFVKGLFQHTLGAFLEDFSPRSRLVIHLDADLYSATLYCLATLNPLIAENTIIIFDEFSDLTHEFAAFHDYCRSFRRQFKVLCRTERYRHVALVAADVSSDRDMFDV